MALNNIEINIIKTIFMKCDRKISISVQLISHHLKDYFITAHPAEGELSQKSNRAYKGYGSRKAWDQSKKGKRGTCDANTASSHYITGVPGSQCTKA